MIATILDYGAGNLHSLAKAIASDMMAVRIENDPNAAAKAELLVLPGVGSFPYAARQIASARGELRDAILAGLPTVGICLGMQLLFASSEEGPGDGLEIFDGAVTRLESRRVPHIGWNAVDDADAKQLATAYFANSYACRPIDVSIVSAWTSHDGDRFPAIVRRGKVCGMQFHPEKSSAAGVALLRRVLSEVAA